MKKWTNTAISIFDYKNLPEGITAKRLEKLLFDRGSYIFVNDPQLGFLTLPWALSGGLNVYGEPVEWYVRSMSGMGLDANGDHFVYNKLWNNENSVLCRNNQLRTDNKSYIEVYVDKLVNLEFAIDNNINVNKTPLVFKGTQDQLLTFKNQYKAISGNEPVLYVDNSMANVNFEVFNTDAPYIVDKLMSAYTAIEGRILNFLGLDNMNLEKRERLLVDEANANKEHTKTNFAAMLDTRKYDMEQVNKMFGLNIEVGLNPELMPEQTELGDNNGTMDNRAKEFGTGNDAV